MSDISDVRYCGGRPTPFGAACGRPMKQVTHEEYWAGEVGGSVSPCRVPGDYCLREYFHDDPYPGGPYPFARAREMTQALKDEMRAINEAQTGLRPELATRCSCVISRERKAQLPSR